jgi:phytoene desaturase
MNKVIVIGGGISGLTAAGVLAKKGFEVKLFEANNKLGGCCATTNLEGYIFNDGAMYLVFPAILDTIFEELGLSRPDDLPLRKIRENTTTFLPGGLQIRFGKGLEWEYVQGDPSVSRSIIQSELETFLDRWMPVVDLLVNDLLMHPFSYSRFLQRGWRHLTKLTNTVAKELNSSFCDPGIRAALGGVLLFAGFPADQLPTNVLTGLVALLSDGFYLPEGGMGKIPQLLQRAITRYGVEIHLGRAVDKIVIKHQGVVGCKISDGEFFPCNAVIASPGGLITYSKLMDPSNIHAKHRRKLNNSPLSHTAISLQLGLSTELNAPSHMVNRIPYLENQYQVFDFKSGGGDWLCYSVPTVTMPELAPVGGSVVEMYLPIPQDVPLEIWDEVHTERLTEKAIQILNRQLPGQGLEIVVKRVRSPKDFQENMYLYRGALYGLSPAAKPQSYFNQKTGTPGLYLAGQTTYPGYGIVSTGMSGIFAARAVMENIDQ